MNNDSNFKIETKIETLEISIKKLEEKINNMHNILININNTTNKKRDEIYNLNDYLDYNDYNIITHKSIPPLIKRMNGFNLNENNETNKTY